MLWNTTFLWFQFYILNNIICYIYTSLSEDSSASRRAGTAREDDQPAIASSLVTPKRSQPISRINAPLTTRADVARRETGRRRTTVASSAGPWPRVHRLAAKNHARVTRALRASFRDTPTSWLHVFLCALIFC